jgi:hypothetical protein
LIGPVVCIALAEAKLTSKPYASWVPKQMTAMRSLPELMLPTTTNKSASR